MPYKQHNSKMKQVVESVVTDEKDSDGQSGGDENTKKVNLVHHMQSMTCINESEQENEDEESK